MLRSLTSGVSGLQQFQQQMDVIGNNISNVNTTGYKSSQTSFVDAFSVSLQEGVDSMPVQVGTGVGLSSISSDFGAGTMTRTDVMTHLAIDGQGFFEVRDAISDEKYFTRDGSFQTDKDGYLVTARGLRVQGYSDGTQTTMGDLKIDAGSAPATADPAATLMTYNIGEDGLIKVRLSDKTEYVRGQVLLQNVQNPQALVKAGDNNYQGIALAGPLGAAVQPHTNGTGGVRAGKLEMSNVDLAREFATMITTQRAFQANARIITTSDEILQELVNIKR